MNTLSKKGAFLPALVLVLTVGTARAATSEEYRSFELTRNEPNSADIAEVKWLGTRVAEEETASRTFENRFIVATIGLQAVASDCEDVQGIERTLDQSSLESKLVPSDTYIRVVTAWRAGCESSSAGSPQLVKFEVKYFIDQRPIAQKGQPWPAPVLAEGDATRYFSFDSGMIDGHERWALYRLDYADLRNVKFDFKKTYGYVQGQAIAQ
jgi:hypothetical protein